MVPVKSIIIICDALYVYMIIAFSDTFFLVFKILLIYPSNVHISISFINYAHIHVIVRHINCNKMSNEMTSIYTSHVIP